MKRGLSELAIYAATGINNQILGRATERDYKDTRNLGNHLQEYLKERAKYGLLEGSPIQTQIMWKTFGKKQRDTEEVALQTFLFGKKLTEVEKLTDEELSKLMSTCVNLSKIAMTHENPFLRKQAA